MEEQLHLAAKDMENTNIEGTTSTCYSRYRSRDGRGGAIKSSIQNSQHKIKSKILDKNKEFLLLIGSGYIV
jgi:hypothetical protein